ncbi:MAG TPA: outer membrane beta-barrel protein [Gemmatimonadota bacterium]|nr:outer membrane beta-barrel protein [Gemmatimonadota bacterium]
MRRIFPILNSISAIQVLLCLLSGSGVKAQPDQGTRDSGWELNLHAAALRPGLFDESAGALQFGGRLFRNFGNGLSIGANADWARASDITLSPFAGLSASFLLYSAELEYGFRVSPRTVFFLGAGVGAATVGLDDVPIGAAKSSTGLLVPAGGGIKIHNRATAPSWALRFDVRDNVILLETLATDGGVGTEPRHNVEASLGLSFLFGGGGERVVETVEERDADRDGVPDPRDFCLNRAGAVVDARGCPLRPEPPPELEAAPAEPDADQDGVPDSRDGCMETLSGVAVEADGCPAAEEAPVETDAGDEDGDGVADDLDACHGTPAGIPIDERGCLARLEPSPQTPERTPEPVPFPEPIDVPEAPRAEPEDAAACLDTSRGRRVIEFDGRRFESAGFPQPVDRQFLVSVGSFDGIPLYVSDTAQPPFGDFWVPRCGDDGTYDLYVEVGALP